MPEPVEVFAVPLGPLQANCFIVVQGEQGLVIDPGDEANVVIQAFTEFGFAPAAVLVTHGHFDHFGGVAPVARHFDIPVYVGAEDAGQMADGGLGVHGRLRHRARRDGAHHRGRADARPAHPGARRPDPGPLARLLHLRHRRGRALRRRPPLPEQRRPHRPARRQHGPAAQLRRRRSSAAFRRTPPCTAVTVPTRRSVASSRSTRSSRPSVTTRSTAGELAARPQGHLRPAAGRGRGARRRRRRRGARVRRLRLPPRRHPGVRGDGPVRARRRRGHRHRAQGDVHLHRQGRPLADAASRGHGAHLPRLRRSTACTSCRSR